MINELNSKVQDLIIDGSTSVLHALKKMDKVDRKLLIVLKDSCFSGLVSIGDIQRAIIQNKSFDTKVSEILRSNITVAKVNDDPEEIKMKMIEERIEYMPVINDDNILVDVIFWENIFGGQIVSEEKLNIPVVIMAGGEGTRLKPLTNILPKPLIPIVNKTIIEDIMEQFAQAGCTDFYISLNYKADMIKHYLQNLRNYDYNFYFFQEEKPLGTAGSLYLLTGILTSTFFVTNCDIIIKQNLSEIYSYHLRLKNDITVIAALKNYYIPYGTVESGIDGLLTSILEKPELVFKINTGVYIVESRVLSHISSGEVLDFTDLILKIKEIGGRVGVFPISEKSWLDYGLLDSLPFITK